EDGRASMAAGIDKGTDFAVLASNDEERVTAPVEGTIVSCVWDLAFVAGKLPRPAHNLVLLLGEDLRVGVDLGADEMPGGNLGRSLPLLGVERHGVPLTQRPTKRARAVADGVTREIRVAASFKTWAIFSAASVPIRELLPAIARQPR